MPVTNVGGNNTILKNRELNVAYSCYRGFSKSPVSDVLGQGRHFESEAELATKPQVVETNPWQAIGDMDKAACKGGPCYML